MPKVKWSESKKRTVWEMTKGICFYCGVKMLRKLPDVYSEHPRNLFTIDHILPVKRGGKNNIENLLPCCFICNVLKNDKSFEEFTNGRKCLSLKHELHPLTKGLIMEDNKIKDKSGDKKYFIMVPKLVWLKARDPYDLAFWATVKDIAGDDGECDITTKNLAVLCMMSVGKVSECRSYWIGTGLLDGQREKNPNERNAIWHLSIPDFWKENIEQAKIFKTQKSRIEFKKKQQLNSKKTDSYSETVTVSPGEIGYSSHETDCTPHETAYLYREKPLEEPVEKPAPKNGADKNIAAHVKSSEPSNFEKLIDWWYKCKGECTPPTPPPYFNHRRFTDIVMDRIDGGRTWKQISDAMRVYWRVVKSPLHYYTHKVNISRFIGETIDDFWDCDEAWENFKDKKKNANSDNGKKVVAPWEKPWNPLEQKGLVQNAATPA